MARNADDPEAAGDGDGRTPGLGDRVEYALLRLLGFVLLSLDLRAAMRLARFLAGILHRVDRRHREVGEENLRRAYRGALPEPEVRRIVRRVYENLGVTVAEAVHAPRRLRGRAARRAFEYSGLEEAKRVVGDGPILFLSAHLGNWEYLVPAARAGGVEVLTVARPLDNPLLDRWVTRFRESIGHRSLPKEGALKGLLRTARSGKSIGLLVDQNGGRHGRLSSFFGLPCSTQAAGISLARRLGSPFFVATIERRAPGFHRFVVGPPVYVGDDDAAEREALDELNRQLEERVRRHPDHWMWLHRRWRIKAAWGFPAPATDGKEGP
jgi:KDO2-lipid IV(A) lauroyltransferase